MITETAPTTRYTDREKAIARMTVSEIRAHIGPRAAVRHRALRRAGQPRLVRPLLPLWIPGHYKPGQGDLDYVNARAINAAHEIQPYTSGNWADSST